MGILRLLAPGLLLAMLPPLAAAQQPGPVAETETAATIMTRVAANQDRAEDERHHYVYLQHTRVLSRKGKTAMCEEITDSRITPSSKASKPELLKLNGRMLVKHKYVTYTSLLPAKDSKDAAAKDSDTKVDLSKDGAPTDAAPKDVGPKDTAAKDKPVTNDAQTTDVSKVDVDHHSLTIEVDDDTDRDLVENMRANLLGNDDADSKDGIDTRLFPLTTKAQEDYNFRLLGRERMNDHDVFHVIFRPKDKDDFGWKGDAYIDTVTYQPVVVSTDIARKVPFAVRALLGTNVPGLGFTVVYAPQPDGVWFPISFSTEFKIHVLFFFSREIIIDAHNSAFEKTHVTTKLLPDAAPAAQ